MEATQPHGISSFHRYAIAIVAFLGWMFAGVQLAVISIVMREAVKDLLGSAGEGDIGRWFGWLTAGFMFGAAAGGYLLGWAGDRWGRKTAIIMSIACYSIFAGCTYFVTSSEQLLLMRFMVGFGVGGMWPNGISLVSEAWPNLSRPTVAGIIGSAANIGTMLFSILTCFVFVTTENWRWVMLLGLVPIVLAFVAMFAIPESPQWLSIRKQAGGDTTNSRNHRSPLMEIFLPPLLKISLLGILLGTIPLFGGWGSSNWANAWASEVGENKQQLNPTLKAQALLARSAPGSVASLLGGVVASWLGRRLSYFVFSLGCLICSLSLFQYSHPSRPDFLWWTAGLGIFNGFFFGWLPYCLPELFPTRVRATGAGVSFNFGRIATSFGILVAAALLKETFGGDYARIGQFTSWVYLVGAIAIWFIPQRQQSVL
jgi:MFS family permease